MQKESLQNKWLVELTSIPIFEQRLIFRGKQLQWEQTIAQCGIQRDVNL
jgi:E3 ubiquitin-protein ligase NEDD4